MGCVTMIKGLKDLQDLNTKCRRLPVLLQSLFRSHFTRDLRNNFPPCFSRASANLLERNPAIPSILKILVLDLRIKSKRL